MNLNTIWKGFLFKKNSDGKIQKFLPRTEAELVTLRNGTDIENEIRNTANPITSHKSGYNIDILDAANKPPLYFKLYGTSKQTITTGAQLLKSPFQSDYDSYEPGRIWTAVYNTDTGQWSQLMVHTPNAHVNGSGAN